MIKVGQKVRFIPIKTVRMFGLATGEVTYVNAPHKWFLVEYAGRGNTLRIGFKFSDIGQSVRVCDEADTTSIKIEPTKLESSSNMDRKLSLAEYLAERLKIMKELCCTPSPKEWKHLTSLDSEIKIDQAIRKIMKDRWAKSKAR